MTIKEAFKGIPRSPIQEIDFVNLITPAANLSGRTEADVYETFKRIMAECGFNRQKALIHFLVEVIG